VFYDWELAISEHILAVVGTINDVRRGGHNIASVEWIVELSRSNQSTCVGDVGHEKSTVFVSNCPELAVVPVPRVRGSATYDQFWFEETGLGSQRVVVDQI